MAPDVVSSSVGFGIKKNPCISKSLFKSNPVKALRLDVDPVDINPDPQPWLAVFALFEISINLSSGRGIMH